MLVHPQSTRILVEPIPEADGKIVLPDAVFKDENGEDRQAPIRWRVVAKGPGRRCDDGDIEAIPLDVGDEVVFDGRFGTKLEPTAWYGGKRYVVIEYGAVLAKIERAPGERVTWSAPAKPNIVVAHPIAR